MTDTGGWWVVVLSWNGREDTLACLRSLAAADPRPQVVCVDNGSTDGSAASSFTANACPSHLLYGA